MGSQFPSEEYIFPFGAYYRIDLYIGESKKSIASHEYPRYNHDNILKYFCSYHREHTPLYGIDRGQKYDDHGIGLFGVQQNHLPYM